ncbi:MAG: hypothetical protein H0X37_02020 [Herpetosiphonaceae bacterium]|nr:hypothetical protein [Herpetosiphonaceae bacterium]
MSKLLKIIGRMLKQVFSPAAVWRGLVGRRTVPPPAPTPRADDGHERSDVQAIPVLMTGVGLLVTVAVISAVVWGLFTFLVDHPRADAPLSPLASQRVPSGAPRLEVAPRTALADTLRRSDAVLGSYGWVDRQHSIVHIPIDHAIELLAQRGLPVRSTGTISATGSTGGPK